MKPLLLPYIFNILVLVPIGLLTLFGGERGGRQNRYRIRTDLPLRHPIEADCTIGDLLRLIHRQC